MTAAAAAGAPPFSGIHLQGPKLRENGGFPALTIFNKGAYGVLVWAGYVPEDAPAVEAGTVNPAFVVLERVSFMFWDDLREYFPDNEYSRLVEKIRRGLPAEWRDWNRRGATCNTPEP